MKTPALKSVVRAAALLLALLLVAPLCAGCGKDEPPADTSSAEAETEPAAPETVDIVREGEILYSLIRADSAGESLKSAYKTLAAAFREKFGSIPAGGTDWVKEKPEQGEYRSDSCEILLGETNRIESCEVYFGLGEGEYAVRAVGTKIVIVGRNEYLTYLGACRFAEEFIFPSDGGTMSVPAGLSITGTPYASSEPEPVNTEFETVEPSGEPIRASSETWRVCEISFVSDKEYEDPVYTVDTDVLFRNKSTGKVMKLPAFWDGGLDWKVRFAPPETGEWEFYTVCSDMGNRGLHHRTGTVECVAYTGNLDVYLHGFPKTVRGKSYFVYDDGTPFFYLADTHWTLALEEIDGHGSVETQGKAGITREYAGSLGITSQFKYIMDYRAAQGYTVIQSQPLGWWTNPGQNGWFADEYQNIFTYGVNSIMLGKFQRYDLYFDYIAELGLVHSNTQFGYPTALMTEYFAGKITDSQLEKLCRYWVARYGAYPVMWATTQEGDNDYYGERGDCEATPETNPWLLVIDYVDKYDAYGHPSTCHQENAAYTQVKNSAFGPKESHDWYAAQYNTDVSNGRTPQWDMLREYYGNPGSKPVVNYEGRYDHFWVGTFGARAQGWIAYMNGQVGYGYGVQPIWSIFWSNNAIANYTASDEKETFTLDANWVEGLYSEAGEQVTFIRKFLSNYEWWKLVPCFDCSYYYKPSGGNYSVSTIGSELYLGYFWGTGRNLGRFTSMKNGEYVLRWFNCRTGEYTEPERVTVTGGGFDIPAKPDEGDWAIEMIFAG